MVEMDKSHCLKRKELHNSPTLSILYEVTSLSLSLLYVNMVFLKKKEKKKKKPFLAIKKGYESGWLWRLNLYLNIILNLTNIEFNLIRTMVQMMVK